MKKVSIITPCYNGEKFIDRYMEMILAQTYSNLELVFVNDGSIDRTEEIIKSYESEMKKKNIDFVYYYQQNSGQAVAINKGLKLFTGEYFIYPDSDDVLLPDSIAKRVEFLERNKEYDLVTSKGWEADERDLNKRRDVFWMQKKEEKNLFLKIIEKKVNTHSMSYMFRSEAFLKINPDREIYINPNSSVQDVQMILPMAYSYRCGFIDEYMYIYVMRESSHSHIKKSVGKTLDSYDDMEDIFVKTIDSITMPDYEKLQYKNIVKNIYDDYRKFALVDYFFNQQFVEMKEVKEYIIGNKNLAFFGTGDDGLKIMKTFTRSGIYPTILIDNDKRKQGKYINNIPIKSINEIRAEKDKYVILITSRRYTREIKEQLINLGFNENMNFYTYYEFLKKSLL